jgi:hypothetical protein
LMNGSIDFSVVKRSYGVKFGHDGVLAWQELTKIAVF